MLQQGELWKNQRKLITPLFHFNSLKTAIPSLTKLTKQWIANQSFDDQIWHEVVPSFLHLTNKSIVEFAFGSDFDASWMINKWKTLSDILQIYWAFKFFFGSIISYLPIPYLNQRKVIIEQIRSKAKQAIQQRRSNPSQNDVSFLYEIFLSF
jgi:hypothetical protein